MSQSNMHTRLVGPPYSTKELTKELEKMCANRVEARVAAHLEHAEQQKP